MSNLLDMMNEMFSGNNPPNSEQLFKLMEETFSFMKEMKVKFESDDPKKREEAVKEATELRKAFEEKLGELSKKTGLDLSTFLQNPVGLPPEELVTAKSVQERFEELMHPSHHKMPQSVIR